MSILIAALIITTIAVFGLVLDHFESCADDKWTAAEDAATLAWATEFHDTLAWESECA